MYSMQAVCDKEQDCSHRHNVTWKKRPSSQQSLYHLTHIIGKGSFGVVYRAVEKATGDVVAIKKVLLKHTVSSREVCFLSAFQHPHIIELHNIFYDQQGDEEQTYLNLVMPYVETTLNDVLNDYRNNNRRLEKERIKLYTYQLTRALAYLHNQNIAHRDVTPRNILVCRNETESVKLSDFGSAKVLSNCENHGSYMCSRPYRAPELIFGAVNYTTQVDVWSLGCILAEMLLGRSLFVGDSNARQLVNIIKILGTPSPFEIASMNPQYSDLSLPSIPPSQWKKIFSAVEDLDAIDLLERILRYDPSTRPTPLQILCHPFFDELRRKDISYNKIRYTHIFDFLPLELRGCDTDALNRLIPVWVRDDPSVARTMREFRELLHTAPSDASTSAFNTPAVEQTSFVTSPPPKVIATKYSEKKLNK